MTSEISNIEYHSSDLEYWAKSTNEKAQKKVFAVDRKKGISFTVYGKRKIDLPLAVVVDQEHPAESVMEFGGHHALEAIHKGDRYCHLSLLSCMF